MYQHLDSVQASERQRVMQRWGSACSALAFAVFALGLALVVFGAAGLNLSMIRSPLISMLVAIGLIGAFVICAVSAIVFRDHASSYAELSRGEYAQALELAAQSRVVAVFLREWTETSPFLAVRDLNELMEVSVLTSPAGSELIAQWREAKE